MKPYFFLPFILQGTLWWIVMKPIMSLFLRLEVRGYEHIKDTKGPAIFAPNHQHPIDVVLLPLALPLWSRFSPMFYVTAEGSKHTGWRKKLFSTFNLELIGSFALTHDKKDYAKALERHVQILKDGGSVCIFPEGRMSRDGKIARARGGVSYLAGETKLPTIPVLIRNTRPLSLFDFFFMRRKVSIEFFPPIYFQVERYTNSEVTSAIYHSNAERILNILREAKGEEAVAV